MSAFLIGSGGAIFALITAVVGYFFGRKERNANAEATTVKSAVELNASMAVRIGKLEERADQREQVLDRLERRDRIQGRLLIKHEMWDLDVVAALQSRGLHMRPPPSLDVDDEPDPGGPRTRAEDYGHRAAETEGIDRRAQP